MRNNMSNFDIKQKFRYWLDKKMSKGTMSIIMLLSMATFFLLIFVAILNILFRLRDNIFPAFWDSLANTINTEMPYSEDGDFGYIVLNTITALVGLLFTSILIGVVSSGIEQRLDSLRRGNSLVLEKNHTIILGYNLGEHGLLRQLIIATGNKNRKIVILTDIEKPDLESDLHNNLDVPKNIEIICRNGDITNINDLRCCSIEKSELIIVNALNDNRRIKTILAVLCLRKEFKECNARMVACVSNERYLLPKNKLTSKNIIMLKTDEIMARIIAHTTTEPGLSIAFKELLNFEENEFYFETEKRFIGKNIKEITSCLDKASIVGIRRNNKTVLNPETDTIINENDELILFEQEKGSYTIVENKLKNVEERELGALNDEEKGNVFIFGCNTLLETIISELPNDVKNITISTKDEEEVNRLSSIYKEKNIRINNLNINRDLNKIAANTKHFILLADRDIDKEDADINNILLLLNLMNLKESYGYDYNLTVELNMENSFNIAIKNSKIDYIVSSNIASLLLAQISENPKIETVLAELLSKKGNELFSKPLKTFNIKTEHDYSYAGLKQIILTYGYVLIGYSNNEKITLNPVLDTRVQFSEKDRLFVLGKE